MPPFTVWVVRVALIWLSIGWTIGALLLLQAARVVVLPSGVAWLVVHAHVLLFGWIVQLCVGVAFWIFPKFVGRDQPLRGRAALATGAVVALNAGVLASLASPVAAFAGYAVCALLFAAHLWERTRGFGREP